MSELYLGQVTRVEDELRCFRQYTVAKGCMTGFRVSTEKEFSSSLAPMDIGVSFSHGDKANGK
jgi:hypothetical protein